MAISIGINGFGRIGRVALRIAISRPETFKLCGINARNADLDYMVYMIRYDSTFGRFHGELGTYEHGLIINGQKIPVFTEGDAASIPWGSCGAEYIIDATGAAKAISLVIPSLKDKMSGISYRVPTTDVSIVDLNVALKESASYEDICKKVKEASMTYLSGILDYVDDEVVSSDFIGDSHASIFDARQGIQVNSHFFKVICFYDNEWGYTSQIFRLIKYMDQVDHNS